MPPPDAVLRTGSREAGDRLVEWAERSGRRQNALACRGGLRFAFYGRVSTEDYQDPVTSRARQRDLAGALVAGHGRIVAEYFDAIVIGEYDRAFCGAQYAAMAPLVEQYAIQLWAPEAGGRIDHSAEQHEQLMLALGWQSKREITRTRARVLTALAAQTREQGRYLGGRPPYG
jgi:site-specific DNA recombinase